MPKLNLVYDNWTLLQEPDTAGVPQHGRVPWNAEIDVHMRRARIPEEWALILQPCQFQLEVANANRPAIEVVLAWGGGMNIQYCTTAGFLSYISKYITKPEPYGTVTDTDSLRARDGQDMSPVVRFLRARVWCARGRLPVLRLSCERTGRHLSEPQAINIEFLFRQIKIPTVPGLDLGCTSGIAACRWGAGALAGGGAVAWNSWCNAAV